MSEKVRQLRPGSRSDRRHETLRRDQQVFIYMLGANLIVPVLASHSVDQDGADVRWGGFVILLCLASLLLQGLGLILERLRHSVRRDADDAPDLETWCRRADKSAFAEALSGLSMLIASGMLVVAILVYVVTVLMPIVLALVR